MGEPLMRVDAGNSGALADAASRLDRALDILEAAFGRPDAARPFATEHLDTADLSRVRELEAAASTASAALGLAMDEVRRLLHDDPGQAQAGPDQDKPDSRLESEDGLLDDSDVTLADPASHKEPTA